MTDDSSWPTTPRRSADYGASARHAEVIDPAPTRGRHSLSEPDFAPEPMRRGARRFADPEPEHSYESGQDPYDNPKPLRIESHEGRDSSYPSWQDAAVRPRPEPVSDFWTVAETRSQASAVDLEPDLPEHTPESGPSPSPPSSPNSTDEDDQQAVPSRAVKPDLPGRMKRIGLTVLTGILVVALAITIWSWSTRGTWEFASLWPFEVSTSPEPQESPDPENTKEAKPAGTEQALDDTKFSVPSGWSEYVNDQPLPEPGRLVTRLLHDETGVLLQVTSVTPQSGLGDLAEACNIVSAETQKQFKDITATEAIAVGINQSQGAGFTCGFHGTRIKNDVPYTVTFIFLLRASDSHVLILRSMIPDSVSGGSIARQELAGMNCTASLNFGVALPLC